MASSIVGTPVVGTSVVTIVIVGHATPALGHVATESAKPRYTTNPPAGDARSAATWQAACQVEVLKWADSVPNSGPSSHIALSNMR